MKIKLEAQVQQSCRHLLSEINRDPASSTYGCFDRRYWGWKLTDFPEATYQRNLANLAWYMRNNEGEYDPEMIGRTIIAGLIFTAGIQHKDGSFDQAYPFERSFGATGFLLPDLMAAYKVVKDQCTEVEKENIERLLKHAADFLCASNEKHGLISNHLAGAALGLFLVGEFFQNPDYDAHALDLLGFILKNQSPEGWFPEYGGADPGYQTLCMHYLASIYCLRPSEELKSSLDFSLEFLQYFIHPDGSLGGEYGSRRTEVYYPGGIASLAQAFPKALVIHHFMLESIENLSTVTLLDMDMGNMAPLLSSSIRALEIDISKKSAGKLPFESDKVNKEFREAGIIVVGNPRYYLVLGASNGGVLKIFDKTTQCLVEDDCGALAETESGQWISTQSTKMDTPFSFKEFTFEGKSNFFAVNRQKPTPFNYLILRLLNMTVMRIGFLNELIKKIMVSWLIKTDKHVPLVRERKIVFAGDQVSVTDQYTLPGKLRLKSLSHAGKFNSIHMASSRYFTGTTYDQRLQPLDFQMLNQKGSLVVSRTVEFLQRSA